VETQLEEKKAFEQELEQEKAAQEEVPAEAAEKSEQEQEEAVSEEAPGTEEGQEEPETEQASGPGEKKGFFKKREKKDKKDEQIAELTDRVKRQLAEFENFRNRTEKEKSQMYTIGAKDVIEKILPVVDNFERGIKSIPEEEREAPVASGMEMIYKQLMTVLTDLGVTPIEAVGQEFDPNLHNAVMHVENEELGENIVAEEFQKGYQYKDAVLRHSMVSVAN
jgi:molecular chaperone GrpE